MFRRFTLFPLMEEAGGGGGGGAGGGSPKPMTEEDVGRIVNSAITSHMKRLDLDKRFADQKTELQGLLSPITDALAKLAPAAKGDDDEGGKGKGKNKNIDPDIAAQLEKLASDVEAEKQARLTAEQAVKDSEQRRLMDKARNDLAAGLKDVAHPDLHDVWVDTLVLKNRLKVEEGNALLEVEHAPIKGMPPQREFLPLPEALPKLIEHEESKRFKGVASPAGGGGNRGPGGGGGPGKSSTDSKNPLERADARLRQLGYGGLDQALQD